MKIINKIIIGIAVICLLLCGGILVFALNPDMTDALAQRLYGNGNNAESCRHRYRTIPSPLLLYLAPLPWTVQPLCFLSVLQMHCRLLHSDRILPDRIPTLP